MIGIDVETTALAPEDGKLRLVQISDGIRTKVYDAFRQDEELIRRAVEAQDELVAHNAVFEKAWIAEHLDLELEDLNDTMIMSQVLYTGTKAAMRNGFSHSLANVVKRELSKDEQVSDWGAQELTREQIEYAAEYARIMPELARTLMRKIERAGLRKTYELELRVSHAIDAMQRRGVAIHTDRLDAMIEDSTERAERLKAELTEEWGINPGSGKQLIEHFGLEGRKGWPRRRREANRRPPRRP